MSEILTAALPVEFTMDVAVWITLVAVVAGFAFMAFFLLLALGPQFSDSWATRLGASASPNEVALEPQESD